MICDPAIRRMCHADTLVDNLTVREMLMYTAELKLPMSQSLAEKRARVTSIIELLALLPCQNRRIGNAMQRGISGEMTSLQPMSSNAPGRQLKAAFHI